MGIGPEIPAHLLRGGGGDPISGSSVISEENKQGKEEEEGDSDSDYTPDLPPELLKARNQPSSSSASTSKVIAGPQLPPHLIGSRPPLAQDSKSDSEEEEEDFGPGPLPPPASSSIPTNSYHDMNEGTRDFLEREERQRERERIEKENSSNKKLQREEWMLVPPKEMDLMSSMDPTKLKSRSFQSGPKAQKSTRPGGMGDDGPNLWTETPAERQQRLQDEALGKKRKAENANPEELEDTEETRRKRARDRRLKEEVERHNSKSRKESLVDQHEKKKSKSRGGKDKEKEEPQGWDRDRDMSIGGRLIDDGKRKQMIKDAKGLGGRFGSSGFM
ncbi:hypothetical protein JCM3765_003056 [Sporobolomyces pararoseus]